VSPLFAEISSFRNLYRAARIAARGKRYRRSAAMFLLGMEHECLQLESELRSGRYEPGPYRVFRITDPKERTICASPFRDRVVHQALVQVVEPRFERGFIYDSYSCRKGKGTHAALERVRSWVREYPWVLKLDVAKYFPSVDHEITMALLAKRISCAHTLDLFARILGSWKSQEAPIHWFPGDALFSPMARSRGLPIGNLTSQFLSNVVLDVVDHAVKDGLGVRAYARYCDDMVVCARSIGELQDVRTAITRALLRLRLVPHRTKTQILPASQGVPWVGYRVSPSGVRLTKESLRRVRRRLRAFAHRWESLPRCRPRIVTSFAAWQGHGKRGLSASMLAAMTPSPLR
jgi:hypothetical protein